MVTAISARILMDECVRRGLNRKELQAGISCDAIDKVDGRVPVESMYGLWDRAVRLTAEPMLAATIAARVPFGAYRLLDYLLVMSGSPGDALNRSCRSFALMNTAFAPSFRLSGKLAYLELASPDRHQDLPRPYIEYLLMIYLFRLRFAAYMRLRPVEVHFTHGQSMLAGRYHRIFGSPVRFHQTVDRLVFAREAMDIPHRFADAELCEVLQEHANHKLSVVYSGRDLVAEVQDIVGKHLGNGPLTLAWVSRQLGMSSRSLQREILTRGTTFRDLLDRVREKHARCLLRNAGLSLAQVAARLQFSDASSFCRAFQRWTAISPTECRRRDQDNKHW